MEYFQLLKVQAHFSVAENALCGNAPSRSVS